MNKSIYFEIKEAKNGELIPYFQSGKSIDSIYNPDREATTIVSKISSEYDYFIITGLGSGKVVNELLNANKKCRIFVIIIRCIMSFTHILEKRIQYRIKKSKDFVFMLPDFLDLSDRDQIMRALRKLISKGLILKVGQGVYVKAIKSLISEEFVPAIPLAEIGKIVAKKLKYHNLF